MTRRRYAPELKQEALELSQQLGSVAENAAIRLGIQDTLLYNWKTTSKISMDPNVKSVQSSMADTEEFKRLRKENEDLKKTNYILKKTAAFLSEKAGCT